MQGAQMAYNFKPEILTDNVVVHVKTKQELLTLIDWINTNNKDTHSRTIPRGDERYFIGQCISCNTMYGNTWEYCTTDYYKSRGFTVLPYSYALINKIRRH